MEKSVDEICESYETEIQDLEWDVKCLTQENKDLQDKVDFMTAYLKNVEGKLATRPTSKDNSWLEDARMLLSMGCKTIDAGTVAGLVAECEDYISQVIHMEYKLNVAESETCHLLAELRERDSWSFD